MKHFFFISFLVFSSISFAKGRLQVTTEEKCEVVRPNVFEEVLREPKSGVAYMDGKFLSLARREEQSQFRASSLRKMDRDLKKQIGFSLGARTLTESDFENVDNGLIHGFQWSHVDAPHAWYQVVYYYNDDKVSGFVFIMNTNIVAARVIDGELSICDTMFRVR